MIERHSKKKKLRVSAYESTALTTRRRNMCIIPGALAAPRPPACACSPGTARPRLHAQQWSRAEAHSRVEASPDRDPRAHGAGAPGERRRRGRARRANAAAQASPRRVKPPIAARGDRPGGGSGAGTRARARTRGALASWGWEGGGAAGSGLGRPRAWAPSSTPPSAGLRARRARVRLARISRSSHPCSGAVMSWRALPKRGRSIAASECRAVRIARSAAAAAAGEGGAPARCVRARAAWADSGLGRRLLLSFLGGGGFGCCHAAPEGGGAAAAVGVTAAVRRRQCGGGSVAAAGGAWPYGGVEAERGRQRARSQW